MFARKPYVRPARQPVTRIENQRGVMTGGLREPDPKPPEPVRSRPYRMLCASLSCANCGIEMFSQAAHPNSYESGKCKGKKASDDQCFPLCTAEGNDCHRRFDNYELCTAAEMPAFEIRWAAWTQAALMIQAATDRNTRKVLLGLGWSV